MIMQTGQPIMDNHFRPKYMKLCYMTILKNNTPFTMRNSSKLVHIFIYNVHLTRIPFLLEIVTQVVPNIFCNLFNDSFLTL